MRGNSNSVIRAIVRQRRASKNGWISSSSSSCSYGYETLISTPNKCSSSHPSNNPSIANTAKSLFSSLSLQLFQRRTLSSSSGSSNIVLVNSVEQLNSALKNIQEKSLPALLYFTAAWCGPCKVISPVIEELSKKYPHVAVYKIDIDKEGLQGTLSNLDITAVPTLHFHQNGKKAAAIVGADVTRVKDTMHSLYG